MILFKHRRSAERDAFSVPRSVQKSIPIKRIYQDGVFQVSGKFSKTWRFFDVNYAVASPEKQRELFMTYCSFLNSLPIGATAKITLFNRQLTSGGRCSCPCRGTAVTATETNTMGWC